MDIGRQAPVIIAVLILAVVFAGEIVVAVNVHDDFHSEVYANGGDVSFSITSDGSYIYDVISLKDSMGPLSDVSVYYDPNYASEVSASFTSTGARILDEEYYVEQMKATFLVRCIEDVNIIDAGGLSDLMDADGTGHALVMLSGSLPDTVYDGTADSKILKWIESGGRFYWLGNVLGKYVSHGQTVETVENGPTLFLGSECMDDDLGRGYSAVDNGFRDLLYLQNEGLAHSVDTGRLPEGAGYLAMGYTDGSHASMCLVSKGDGMVCVIGGHYSNQQRIDLAQIVASGIGPGTEVVDHVNGNIHGTVEGTIARGDSLYIILGGFFPVFCEEHEVVG